MRLLISMLVVATLVGGLTTRAQAEVFLLRSGGRVEGEWLNPQRGGTEDYLLRTLAGVQLSLSGPQVQRVLATSDVQKQYEELLHKAPTTVAGHWTMAQWCRDANLAAQRKFHLEEIIKLDTNHEEARLALGYGKFATGGWMTPDEYMLRQGYVKSRGQWKLPQEIEIDAREHEFEIADKEWRKKIKMWLDNVKRDNKRAGDSLDAIQSIRDPSAASAIADALEDKDGEIPMHLRRMFLEVLGNLPPGSAIDTLISLSLKDNDEPMRERCLAEIKRQAPHRAVPVYIKALSSKDNVQVKRGAVGLLVMGAESATQALIDALTTSHKFEIQPANPGQMSVNGSGGMTMGQKKVIKVVEINNDEVLSALTSLHQGVNFGFDKAAWRRWFMQSKTSATADLRRGE
jgi:hypothetical protein